MSPIPYHSLQAHGRDLQALTKHSLQTHARALQAYLRLEADVQQKFLGCPSKQNKNDWSQMAQE